LQPLVIGSARGRWVVAAAVLGSGMAFLDSTVVNIALPDIGRDFHVGVSTLQWVVTGYLLTLAAFLLLGGALGDRLGRRRVFSVGVAWFALASVLCGLAPNPDVLVVARVLQGVGAALLTPASLALLQASFVEEDRSRAVGAWAGLTAVAAAAGPLLGGYLIAAGSWRWVFFINVPVGAAVLALASWHVPETRDLSATGRLDTFGVAEAVVLLATLTYGLIEGPSRGWTAPAVLICLVVAVLAAPAFLATERRAANPMLPLALFSRRQFCAVNGVTFVMYGALTGAFFLFPTQLQVVSGYSPLKAGLALLPVTVLSLAGSTTSARLAARMGPRLQMTVGPAVAGIGLLLLVRVTSGDYVTQVLPAMVAFGVGTTIVVPPLTATALSAAPSEHTGVASAVNNVVARTAGLLAVAILPVVAGLTGGAALQPQEFASGFKTAMVIAGVVCIAAGLLAAVSISNAHTGGEGEQSHAFSAPTAARSERRASVRRESDRRGSVPRGAAR
jgi:EmrB/QacA subfamily drug resistance transporter